MVKRFTIIFLVLLAKSVAQENNKNNDLVEWINPLMGTDSNYELSNGNTYPSIALPWGMNAWTPQTGNN